MKTKVTVQVPGVGAGTKGEPLVITGEFMSLEFLTGALVISEDVDDINTVVRLALAPGNWTSVTEEEIE